ncbi:hypothetical protein Leryth_014897 [Lithospermum erythrorhizon]|nr:hypothetical protein Leryth_014897 [Lithospermum erythrorhizon]
MRCDTRLDNGYERPEIIPQGKGPVYLKRHKLSDSDLNILDDCATLAMQDHFIRHMYGNWHDWRLVKIDKALREKATCLLFHGYNYHLTFQAQNGDCVHTLEAQVFDSSAQRLVSRVRMIRPCTSEWYPGDLWIPK